MNLHYTRFAILTAITSICIAIMPLHAQFQRQYGTALNESFGKVIPHGSDYYVLGQAEATAGQALRATVSRINASGQLQWTRRLDMASQWNDAVLTPSGNLFLVGHTLPLDVNSQSLMGVITPAGTFNWLRNYNATGRESFNRVVRNPVPNNAASPYYVLGFQQEPSAVLNWDDVVLLTVSEVGNIGWKKIYSGAFGSTDDEFVRDFEALPNGDLLLAGNWGTTGVIFRADNTGAIFNGVSPDGIQMTFVDVAQAGSNFIAAGFQFPSFSARLMKFDPDLITLWQVSLPGLTAIRNVWTSGSSIYVSGSAMVEGFNRGVVLKFQDGVNGPALQWMKYLQGDETSHTGGTAWPVPAGMAFCDGRNTTEERAFMSVSDLEMNTCMTQTSTTSVTNTAHTFNGPCCLNIDFTDALPGMNAASSLVTWQQAEACSLPCEASITVNYIDNCGHVQLTAVGSGLQPFSYQWCSGESTATIDRILPCGSHDFCVSITCADGTVAVATQTINITDNIPPTALCQPGQGYELNANCTLPVTVAMINAGSFDNCQIQSMSVSPATVQGCGVFPITLTVTDWCGNTSTCATEIQTVEGVPPVIVCPSDLVVSSTNPDSCTATINNLHLLSATDNCSTPQIQYQVTGATSATGLNDASGLTFNTGVSTITYTATDNCGNVSSCSFDVTVLCEEPCPGNIIENSNFSVGAIAGPMPLQGSMANWQAAYGTPVVSTGFGCGDPGYVELQGNKTQGSAIHQQLTTPIQKGKVYELTVCVKSVSCPGCVPYVKMRGIAFNGTLPTTGHHPAPDPDIAIIGVSGRIATCDDWTQFVFHRWRAPKSYNNISISIENSEPIGSNAISLGYIDNICFREVNDSIPCYLAELDSLGNLIPPFGQIDPACPILEDSVDVFMGNVNDIYGYCNPAPNDLDIWYEFCQDSCESIGGEFPDELLDFIENDSLDNFMQDSIGVSTDSLLSDLSSFMDSLELALPNANMLDSIMGVGALAFNCRNLPPQGSPPDDPNSPFNGRDIIFVHGLRTDPLMERLNGIPDALTTWPANRNEFYNGYWKRGAYQYWNTHTAKYLNTWVDPNSINNVIRSGNYSNRYIVVAHPATQTFVAGAHAVIEQIANAMIDGVGVVNCDPTESRPANTFGHNGFIIISHSDGAPLSDIALTVSDLSGVPPLNVLLGDVSFIAERCELHIALQGAFGGSNYASLALMGASTGLQYVKPLAEAFLGFEVNQPTDWLFRSQLLDMSITRHLWGSLMNQVPVCVLTLAGGHPTDFGTDTGEKRILSQLVKHGIHHGFDDGVLSIESQTASSGPRLTYPNRFQPIPGISPMLNAKLFDMGIHRDRAIRYYFDQKLDIAQLHFQNPVQLNFASSGSIPWLSPTGMVQPVLLPYTAGALPRYSNHYTFIQSTADHYSGSIGSFPNFPDYEKTYRFGAPNCEESRVVTSRDVYDVCGVNASKLQQVEYVRGKSITFKIFKRTYTRWIWKRKYHLLKDYKSKNQLDYLYESVLK